MSEFGIKRAANSRLAKKPSVQTSGKSSDGEGSVIKTRWAAERVSESDVSQPVDGVTN